MDSAIQRILRNDQYSKQLEVCRVEYYLSYQSIKRKNIGLKHLQDFIRSANNLIGLYQEHDKQHDLLRFLFNMLNVLDMEMKKTYRREFYFYLCRSTLCELQAKALVQCRKLGNIVPFFPSVTDSYQGPIFDH